MMQETQEVTKIASEAGLLAYVASVGVLGGVTLAAAEGVGRTLKTMERFKESKRIKLLLAMVIGPGVALVAYGAGYLATPRGGPWGWAFAAVMGLLGTFVAKGGKDVYNKVSGRKKKS